MKNKFWKRLFKGILLVFILMNAIAFIHAYKFTHYSSGKEATTKPEEIGFAEKIKTLFTGVSLPRQENIKLPTGNYETMHLNDTYKTEAWYIKNHSEDSSKGTILICHGYYNTKSGMLDRANVLDSLGYNIFMIDFMGSGGSDGNKTTIGFYEADQVKTAFDYLQKSGEKNIYLFGTSMGAVAAMKAIDKYKIQPTGLILECPFGTMYETVAARFHTMKLPTFPMANLLLFWGGAQNGFWAFGHNPTEYALNINCPTLLMNGAKDKNVSMKEIHDIYNNLKAKKTLKVFPEAGHESYLKNYKSEWIVEITAFIGQ